MATGEREGGEDLGALQKGLRRGGGQAGATSAFMSLGDLLEQSPWPMQDR